MLAPISAAVAVYSLAVPSAEYLTLLDAPLIQSFPVKLSAAKL